MTYYILFAATFFISAEILAEKCWRGDYLETPNWVHLYRPFFSLLMTTCVLSWFAIIVISLIKLPLLNVIAVYLAGGVSAFLVNKTTLGYALITSAFTPVLATAELVYAMYYLWNL